MNDKDLDAIIKAQFKSAFDVSPTEVTDDTRRGDLERWDSLGHLDLLKLLSQELQIDIPPEEALDMETVADIKRIVKQLRSAQHADAGDIVQEKETR